MNFFKKYNFELHVVRIMEFNDSKIDSHVSECCERPYPGTDPKFWTFLFTKHVREIACEVFINSIKSKQSPKIMKLVEMS